jgi:hypothetical protein
MAILTSGRSRRPIASTSEPEVAGVDGDGDSRLMLGKYTPAETVEKEIAGILSHFSHAV